MNTEIVVVDNFYNNPVDVRNYAFMQQFDVAGNYPGFRTKSVLNTSMQDTIQRIIRPHGGNVTNWNSTGAGYTGAYQYCTVNDKTWIHADIYNTWSGVCYLTPIAPLNSGTAFYRHKKSFQRNYIDNFFDGSNYDDWEEVDYVANIFNRLILFKGSLFHAAKNYFGTDLVSSRLIQVFFFDTEY